MLELYQKMYAILAGRADDAISALEDIAAREPWDAQSVLSVAEELRQALLEAEELYLNA